MYLVEFFVRKQCQVSSSIIRVTHINEVMIQFIEYVTIKRSHNSHYMTAMCKALNSTTLCSE